MRLHWYVLFGLNFWAVLTVFVLGFHAFVYAFLVSLPVYFLNRNKPIHSGKNDFLKLNKVHVFIVVLVLYYILDLFVGRAKLEANLFINSNAVTNLVSQANSNVTGRGLWDLLGSIFIFCPFVLMDFSRHISSKILLYTVIFFVVFYETGVSRGFLLMAVASVFLGGNFNILKVSASIVFSSSAFFLASYFRGDFESATFSNPMVEAIVWPIFNLSMLIENDCLRLTTFDFTVQFLQKFQPSIFFNKTIFPWNVEMTRCIYPFYKDDIESISIFTWLGEILTYRPSTFTALVSGLILGVLIRYLRFYLVRYNLTSTTVFTGFMSIVLLRSRIQDLFSFFLFLSLFLLAMHLVLTRKLSTL
jgi:hypothetical protein